MRGVISSSTKYFIGIEMSILYILTGFCVNSRGSVDIIKEMRGSISATLAIESLFTITTVKVRLPGLQETQL